MTTWDLDLTESAGMPPVNTTLARVMTHDPAVMAAVLRAAADRLDPPKPAQPVYRGMSRDGEGFRLVYAHDAHCNTAHIAGPDGCPPALARCPAVHASGRSCIRPAHGDAGHKLAYAIGSDALRWDAPGGLPAGTLADEARPRCPEVHPEDGRQCTRVEHPASLVGPVSARRHRATPVGGRRTDADRWVTPAEQDEEAIMARMRQRLTPPSGRKAGAPMPRGDGKAPGTAPESTESA